MMKKLFAGLLSLITMGAMLFAGIPTAIHAVNETATPVADAVRIVGEDATKRGMYEKHFLMSDGSYTVTVYDEPVHYDSNGTWVEVDNTLQLTTNTRGVPQYKTVNGITEVSFAKQFDSQLVTMKQGEYSLSWDINAIPNNPNQINNTAIATKVDAQIIPLDLTGMSNEEAKTIAAKATSTVRYNNALGQGVDLEYIITPSKVKENIILNSPKDITGYRINLYTENLSARLLANNQIELYDADGKVIFTIHSPYMYDSAGDLSEDFTLQMLPSGTGCYAISMKPNADWLSDPSRVYPVVIDPAVAPSNATSNIIDNYVLEGQGVQNGNLDRLYIGKKSGSIARAYIQYKQLPYIPTGSTIRSATQRVNIVQGTSTANNIKAWQVGEEWTSSTIRWSNMPSASLLASNISHNSASYYAFSCVEAINYWYATKPIGTYGNYGFMLSYMDETINDYNAIYSGDYSTASSRPSLTIRYLPPDDLQIVWPVPNHYNVTSEFGYREYINDKGQLVQGMHRGIDISCAEGTTLVAAIGGTVDFDWNNSAGFMLIIQKPGTDFQAHYYHLLGEDYHLVDEGATVVAGAQITLSGNTGQSTGAHLHFQLQYDNNNQLYNPLAVYHEDDPRANLANPNPMFRFENGIYYPNLYFNYSYLSDEYNEVINSLDD